MQTAALEILLLYSYAAVCCVRRTGGVMLMETCQCNDPEEGYPDPVGQLGRETESILANQMKPPFSLLLDDHVYTAVTRVCECFIPRARETFLWLSLGIFVQLEVDS